MSEQKSWKLVNFCEFDKYATKSYCAIHGVDESLNLGDITEVDENEIADFNMMSWGFPCTDISLSGLQKGFIDENGNKTRSGMYYEGIRILKTKRPALSIIENVKALTGNKFKKEFETVLTDLENAGYNSYYKILNSKDYGIPQNRERVFIISIRKDLDNGKFKFPEPFDNEIRLKDVLEEHVDEKFYISQDKVQRFLDELKNTNSKVYHKLQGIDKSYKNTKSIDVANCITAREDRGISNRQAEGTAVLERIGNVNPSGKGQNGTVVDSNGLARTVTIEKGEGQKILVRELELDKEIIRIRKLTPKECFRLQGFCDEDYEKAKAVNSNTQLYKQCGNSITVDVLYYIYVELYKAMPYLFDDLKLSSFFSGIGAFESGLNRLYDGINSGNFTKPQVE